MNKTFFTFVCVFMMCAATMKVQAQSGEIVEQRNVNEKRSWVITPNIRFTNTISSSGSQHYMISHKDGNLYFRTGYSTYPNSKSTLVLKNVNTFYGSPHNSDTRFAIQNDGNLWAWGNNEYGRVGDNSGINRDVPVKILDNIKDITLHDGYVFAVKNDGTVYVWGGNQNVPKERAIFAPEKIDIEKVSYIYGSGSNTVSAVSLSGEVYQWSANDRKPPQKVQDKGYKPLWGKRQPIVSNSNIAIQQSDARRGSYITIDGDLYSWGDVTGNGANIPVPKDNPVLVLQNVKQIYTGNEGWSRSKTYRYALCTDGKLYMVDNDKTFKYVLVASNVYLLILSDYYNLDKGTVSYYANDGCIYKYSYGKKTERIHYDIALPQIKDDAKIVKYSPNGSIQDIGDYFGISDVYVVIIGILIFVVLIILCIISPKFRYVLLIIFAIAAAIAIIVAIFYAIIFIIAIFFILIWFFGGGLGRQWNRDH